MTLFWIVAKRFSKRFVSGGIAHFLLIIGPGMTFNNMADINAILTTLVFGFLLAVFWPHRRCLAKSRQQKSLLTPCLMSHKSKTEARRQERSEYRRAARKAAIHKIPSPKTVS